MSLERIIKTLIDLGLSSVAAETYVYLAKIGPQTVVDLAKALNNSKKEINTGLKVLISKRLVTKDHTQMVALPFEVALELLINQEKKSTKKAKEIKKEYIINWNFEK